jgi:hypothetical protein
MKITNVGEAERASRARATVMAMAAIVLIINAVIEIGSPVYAAPSVRSGIWILLIGMWLLILGTGGALIRNGDSKRLLNDELSLQNRSRAIVFGFYLTMIAALAVYAVGWYRPIETHDSVRLITATGVSASLARYAWLEMW